MNAHKTILLPLIVTLGVAGCASQPYATQPYPTQPVTQTYPSPVYSPAPSYANFGTVESVRMEQGSASTGNGTGGAIVGAVVGGLLGNQVGSGRGRTAATVAGAAGGAMVGAQMGQSGGQQQGMYLIDVRMDNGSFRTLRQSDLMGLQPGSRVRVENNIAYRY